MEYYNTSGNSVQNKIYQNVRFKNVEAENISGISGGVLGHSGDFRVNNLIVGGTGLFESDVEIKGDLTVSGTIIASDTFETKQAVIVGAVDNPTDSIDVGILWQYDGLGTTGFRGLIYSQSSGKFEMVDTNTIPSPSLGTHSNIDFQLEDLYSVNINNTNDLGVSGTTNLSTTNISELNISGNLGVSGSSSLENTLIKGTFGVSGISNLNTLNSGALTTSGNILVNKGNAEIEANSTSGISKIIIDSASGQQANIQFQQNGTRTFTMLSESSGTQISAFLGTGEVGNDLVDRISDGVRTFGNASNTNQILQLESTGCGNIIFYDGSPSGEICYYHPNNSMIFKSNGATGMVLDSSGNLNVVGNLSVDGDMIIDDITMDELNVTTLKPNAGVFSSNEISLAYLNGSGTTGQFMKFRAGSAPSASGIILNRQNLANYSLFVQPDNTFGKQSHLTLGYIGSGISGGTSWMDFTERLRIDTSGSLFYGSATSSGTMRMFSMAGTNSVSTSPVSLLEFNASTGGNRPTFLRFRGGGGSPSTNGGIIIGGFTGDTFYLTGGLGGVFRIKYANPLDITADPLNFYADVLALSNTGDLAIGNTAQSSTTFTILNNTSGSGSIYFNDGSNAGQIEYSHTNNFMKLYANAKVKLDLRDTSVSLGTTADASNTFNIYSGASSTQAITFNFTGVGERGRVAYNNSSNALQFNSNGSTGMVLSSTQGLSVLGTTHTLGTTSNVFSSLTLASNNSSSQTLIFNDGANSGIIGYNHGTNSMTLTTNGLTAVTVDSSQNTKFEGNITIKDTSDASSSLTLVSSTTGSNSIFFNDTITGGEIKYNHLNNNLSLSANNGGNNITLSNTVVSTSKDLTIGELSNASTVLAIANSASGIGDILFSRSGLSAGQINYLHSTDDMTFKTNNTTRMTLDSNGLDINGNLTADNVVSDIYTPVITNVSNVNAGASLITSAMYQRVGDYVSVQIQMDLKPSATASAFVFRLSLPIASNFTNTNQCLPQGILYLNGTPSSNGIVYGSADTVNDEASINCQFTFGSVTTAQLGKLYFSFTYFIQ